MSYGKKDEDADLGLVKVDRTQVFQEGMLARNCSRTKLPPRRGRVLTSCTQLDCSTALQSNRDDAAFF